MIDASPRQITPFVRRRAWGEPRVRAWWLMSAVLLVIAVSLAAEQYAGWSRLHHAVATGTTVPATVIHTVEFGQRKFSSNTPMLLEYDYHGQHFQVQGTLEGLDRYVQEGEVVSLHIDPSEPGNWTARSAVIPLGVALVGPLLVLPVAILAAGVSIAARAKVLKTYTTGAAVTATVTANKMTPLAPRSRAVLCTIAAGGRVIEVFVPPALADLAVGQSVDLFLPNRGGRPLAAAWFEEG